MRHVLLAISFAISPISAAADIVRGCAGTVFVSDLPAGSSSFVMDILELDASGRCSGVSTANNCRILARLALFECYDALWAERNTHEIPAACRPDTGDSNRVNWTRFPGIYLSLPGGQNSWIDRVRHEACCNPSQFGDVTVFIGWTSSGDTGCDGQTSPVFDGGAGGAINPSYTLDCTAQRLRGICGSVPQRTSPGE